MQSCENVWLKSPRDIYLEFEGAGQPPASVLCMSFSVRRNRFIHKVTLNGNYTDCVMHYRAQWLWEHSREERGREIWQHPSGTRPERKKVQEQRGNESRGLGGCQGHLRELSGEADLWRTLLAKPISHVSLCGWVCVCVCVCASWEKTYVQSHQRMQQHTLHSHPGGLEYSRGGSVHRFKDQSWSSSTQKIKCVLMCTLSMKWHRE